MEIVMQGLTDGEKRRLKALGAKLRKAQRDGNTFDACRVEREIELIRRAAGLDD
jgi:hypothetical protein